MTIFRLTSSKPQRTFCLRQAEGLAGALEEKQEIERLRKRLAEAEEELEIIKKATAYFARERLGRNTPRSKK